MFNGIGMNMSDHEDPRSDSIITGWWSHSAAEEQKKYGKVHSVLYERTQDDMKLLSLPKPELWNVSE